MFPRPERQKLKTKSLLKLTFAVIAVGIMCVVSAARAQQPITLEHAPVTHLTYFFPAEARASVEIYQRQTVIVQDQQPAQTVYIQPAPVVLEQAPARVLIVQRPATFSYWQGDIPYYSGSTSDVRWNVGGGVGFGASLGINVGFNTGWNNYGNDYFRDPYPPGPVTPIYRNNYFGGDNRYYGHEHHGKCKW